MNHPANDPTTKRIRRKLTINAMSGLVVIAGIAVLNPPVWVWVLLSTFWLASDTTMFRGLLWRQQHVAALESLNATQARLNLALHEGIKVRDDSVAQLRHLLDPNQ